MVKIIKEKIPYPEIYESNYEEGYGVRGIEEPILKPDKWEKINIPKNKELYDVIKKTVDLEKRIIYIAYKGGYVNQENDLPERGVGKVEVLKEDNKENRSDVVWTPDQGERGFDTATVLDIILRERDWKTEYAFLVDYNNIGSDTQVLIAEKVKE